MRKAGLAAALVAIVVSTFPLAPCVRAEQDPFPFPEGLRPQVEFWKDVFAVWRRDQVALHDSVHLGLVYELLDLEGELEDTYTDDQRDFVRGRREALEARLRDMSRRIESGEPLDDDQKHLAVKIATTVGTDALQDAHSRVRSQRGLRERFLRGVEYSSRYDGLFREAFREAGLPEELALLPHVESSFQYGARSSAGAVGMWQFTRPAARRFMTLNAAIDERLDPVASARGAARYLGSRLQPVGRLGARRHLLQPRDRGDGAAKGRFGTDFREDRSRVRRPCVRLRLQEFLRRIPGGP
jgi:membrane-bound lytic murein transglycosylase D